MMSSSTVVQWSESQKSTILNAYGRTSETLLQDIENIKVWMTKQPHLPEIPADRIIENFLLINKFRIEKVKKKLDMYYSVRSIIPEFYDMAPNGPAIRNLMDVVYFIPLPKITKNLERVIISQLKDSEKDFDIMAFVSYTLHVTEIRLREEPILEEHEILDLAGLKLHHLAKFTPSLIRKINFIMEKVFSRRIKGIHLINASSFMDSSITLVKAVMTDKMSKRIHVHKNLESLQNVVQKDVLPLEYGGEERCMEELSNEWKKKFLEYDGVLQHARRLKVDENKRQGDRPGDDFFELQGNFRQLAID